jgi:ssDNA thymidine ADP-ribosyltransferase, DarT
MNAPYTHPIINERAKRAMSSIDYLSGTIYHMIHFDNLQSIFQRRALLSKAGVAEEAISYQSIAYEEVQNLRDRIFVWDVLKRQFRSLHSYVPFYFATHTPMLFVQHKKGIQNEIVILEVSRLILKNQGVLFTDGNASNQQLSRYTSEVVDIVPATSLKGTCRRRYRPSGPKGSNVNCTEFYSDIMFLDRLKWDIINDRWFIDDERKRIKHAEVLVPDILPLGQIKGISARTQIMVQAVNKLIAKNELVGRIPSALWQPNLYF